MKKVTLLAGLAAVMLASCNNEEMDVTNVPIDLHFGVATTAGRASITEDKFEDGNQVGVYMGALTTDEKTPGELGTGQFNNVPYQFNGTSWSGAPIYWQNTANYHTLYAYAPYSANVTTEITINVPADQGDAEQYKAVDFLWGQLGPMLATTAQQTFNLSHKMSQLVITIEKGDGMEESELTDMTLAVNGVQFASDGTFNLKDGTCTATGTPASTTLTPYRNGNTFYAIVLPGTALKDAKIVLTAQDNTTYSYTLGDVTTKGSNKYTFNLSVTKASLELTEDAFTIKPWGTGDEVNGDASMDTTTP